MNLDPPDEPVLPNPFASARRTSGLSVRLQADDIPAGEADEVIERLLQTHGPAIAVRMIEAGARLAMELLLRERTDDGSYPR